MTHHDGQRLRRSIECWILQPGAGQLEVLLLRVAPAGEIPAYVQPVTGGIESGESPEEACIREVHEETGILLEYSRLHRIAGIYRVPIDGGLIVEKALFFSWTHDQHVHINPEEHIGYVWVSWQQAPKVLHWQSNKDTWKIIVETATKYI